MTRVKHVKARSAKQLANDQRLRERSKAGPDIFVKKNLLGPDDVDQPQQTIKIITPDGGGSEAVGVGIAIVDPAKFDAKAADEAFMNELVEIQIESTDDPNEPLFIESGHNGVTQYVKRGEPQTIKRKFLYSLIAGKQARLVSSFGKNADGKEFNRLAGPSVGTHRIVVISDTAKGRAAYNTWAQTV
jgi:hypothetical protein